MLIVVLVFGIAVSLALIGGLIHFFVTNLRDRYGYALVGTDSSPLIDDGDENFLIH
jgi:hypothetical protein